MKKIFYLFLFWQISHLILAQGFVEKNIFYEKNIKKYSYANLNYLKQKNKIRIPIFQVATKPHRGRIVGLSTTAAVSYTATMLAVGQLWYANYEQTHFHFFNDNGEWNQIDKVGHSWTAYAESVHISQLYKWAGVESRKSAYIGAGMAWFFQMGIEAFDGFSAAWGASLGDIAANTTGSLLMLGQELAWQEQRILFKYIFHGVDYSHFPADVQTRAAFLYGTNWQESLLKDYNGQSYWLSFNPWRFSKKESPYFPNWLALSVGYSSNDVFGGFSNRWKNEDGDFLDYSDIERYRQFFLSVDIDFTQIPTQSDFLKAIFRAINIVKIPAPAFEINSKGQARFHALYPFLRNE